MTSVQIDPQATPLRAGELAQDAGTDEPFTASDARDPGRMAEGRSEVAEIDIERGGDTDHPGKGGDTDHPGRGGDVDRPGKDGGLDRPDRGGDIDNPGRAPAEIPPEITTPPD
ncbi:hypothetical protein [Aurantiacibacter spongiae]|uniref:Uncharacterized protein n=1 Tax=Aurantiacibacter spongiae TaxID=2488860 RepID=A0A3N5CS72_9SPHN|nr:hypothetical protein [Aurantiacibacter spongiae]RPF71974.1 hypothetical protein EG799_10385 [Aurantiacibacter spongiae]